jgi:hypothetical protein
VGVLARGDASRPSWLKLLEIALKVVDLLQFQRPEWTRSVAARIVVPERVTRNALLGQGESEYASPTPQWRHRKRYAVSPAASVRPTNAAPSAQW